MLSTLELARFLGVSSVTARRLVDSGRIPGWRTEGSHRRVSEATARAYRSAASSAEEFLARWLAAAEAGLRAAEDALGPEPAGGQAFAAAATTLNTRLDGTPVRAPASSQDRENLDLADAVEAGITGGHIRLDDGRVVTWEATTLPPSPAHKPDPGAG